MAFTILRYNYTRRFISLYVSAQNDYLYKCHVCSNVHITCINLDVCDIMQCTYMIMLYYVVTEVIYV